MTSDAPPPDDHDDHDDQTALPADQLPDDDPDGGYDDDYEWDDEEPAFGEKGAEDNPSWLLKWFAEGAESLGAVVAMLRAAATDIEDHAERGWALSHIVDGGWVVVHWAGPGEPPQSDREQWVVA